MEFKLIGCLLFSLYLIPCQVNAQMTILPDLDTLSISLEEAVELAIQNNPNLARVKLGSDLLEKQIQGAKAAGFPQIKGSGGFTDNFSLPQQLLPGEIFGQSGQIPVTFGVRFGLNAGVEINQQIYNRAYKSNLAKLDAARSTVGLQYLSSLEDLVYNVVQLYIQIQTTKEQKFILLANLDQLNALVDIARAQYENGIAKKLDADQISVNRTNLLSEINSIDISLAEQLNAMRFYLALDMQYPLELNERIDNRQALSLSDTLLLSSNINYQLLIKELELNHLDDQVIKAAYYPTLSIFAQYNYTGQANQLNFQGDNYSDFAAGLWGVNLSVPIFDGFRTKRKLEENQIIRKQLELDIHQLGNSTKMQFGNASNKIKQNQKLIQTQQANMTLAQEVYDISKLSFQEGVAPLTDLLSAETGLRQSQSQYLSALINLKLAELEYIRASGQLAQLIRSNQ